MLRDGRGRVLVGSRFLAVAQSVVPVVAGTLRMPAGRSVRYTALGAVLWGLVYAGLGGAAPTAARQSAHLVGPTVTGVVVVVAVALGVQALRRHRSEHV